MMYNFAPHGGE